MKFLATKILVLGSLLFSSYASAFTINGTVKGDTVIWDNVFSSYDGNNTISDWGVISGLPPTKQWSPGGPILSSTSMTLSGSNGNSSAFEVNVNGMEYNLGGNPSASSISGIFSSDCSGGSLNGSTAYVIGTDCAADYTIENGSSVAPFYFYRPLFKIDESDLIASLNGQDAGMYTGTVPIQVVYFYVSTGGAHTYFQVSETLTVSINYIPSYLTSVEISDASNNGLGNMTPVYLDYKVSAEAIFDVKITGFFMSGVSLDFATAGESAGGYVLSGPDSTTIPYSVTCTTGCDYSGTIIDAGTRVEDEITTNINVPNIKLINLQLTVSYSNISAEDVETGTYNGSFTVLFEEIM